MSQLPPNSRLIEGIVTTIAGPKPFAGIPGDAPVSPAQFAAVNIAPMGPIIDAEFTTLILRPFTSSTTYRNLRTTGEGVFHITDDALLIARAAIGLPIDVPTRRSEQILGVVLTCACRAYEFVVTKLDNSKERTHIEAQIVHVRHQREFLGFNRAKHAVIEAAILATRIHLTGTAPVLEEMKKLQVLVDKTGAEPEHQAMRELRSFVEGKS